VIGQILAPRLCEIAEVIALDISDQPQPPRGRAVKGSVTDRALLDNLSDGARATLHLATGASRGWEGLCEVDIRGTKAVIDAAVEAGIARVIYASSNHVVGGHERDAFRRGEPLTGTPLSPHAPPRPDSEYGAAKLFGEGYGRFVAENSSTAVSCLRIGTVRPTDDPTEYLGDPAFSAIPRGDDGRLKRLRKTWLRHEDLWRIVSAELVATERFRLRFATSEAAGGPWLADVLTWGEGVS
jgi:NAD+ dependent glucose-6-phosphate dehydrogenase